jgi:hypothetical protein
VYENKIDNLKSLKYKKYYILLFNTSLNFLFLKVGDVFPKGDCRDLQRCDLNNGTFKLVTVPATKKCPADEWCTLNGLGEYNCGKTPGKSNEKQACIDLFFII